MRRHIYGPQALCNGFQDPAKVPEEVRRTLEQPENGRIEDMLEIVLNSRRVSSRPSQPTLLVWGADDRLPNAELAVGRRLHQNLPGSRFEVIDQAGHMPQVEQPDRFVRLLRDFVSLLPEVSPIRRGAAC